MAILIACGAGAGPAAGQARQGAPNFEIATEEGAFRGVAEAFITAAAADNRRKLADMLSPAVVGRTGARSLERFLAEEVLAFFNPYKELARSASVTRTADVRGFAFYMDMVSVTGELHPFVIYVIEERGAKVVANVHRQLWRGTTSDKGEGTHAWRPNVKARGPARIAELEQLGCIEAAMSLPARGKLIHLVYWLARTVRRKDSSSFNAQRPCGTSWTPFALREAATSPLANAKQPCGLNAALR